VLAELGGPDEQHQSEAAMVVEHDARRRVGVHHHMVMLFAAGTGQILDILPELPRLALGVDAHPSAHSPDG
jgi:hypothetical protein